MIQDPKFKTKLFSPQSHPSAGSGSGENVSASKDRGHRGNLARVSSEEIRAFNAVQPLSGCSALRQAQDRQGGLVSP